MMKQEALIAILKKSFADCWSRETSLDDERWTQENPTWGHCAIASLVAQVVLGGDLLRYDLKGTPFEHMRSHYKNRLPDGTIVDFTEAQFGANALVLPEPVVRSREEVLDPVKYPKTVERYKLFLKRVREWLYSFRSEK